MFRKISNIQKFKSLLIISAVILAYCIRHILSFRLGIFYEESRDASAYLLFLKGYLPYRDFAWLYGPFSFYIYPFIMKVFGVNLVILRISYLVFASFLIPLVYFLARRLMSPFWAGIAAFLSIIFFDVPYYTYNHVFAVLGEIASLIMVCRFVENKRKMFSLFWAGIFCSVVLLTKPLTAGIASFIAISLFLLILNFGRPLRDKIKAYSVFFASMSLLPLGFYLYFYLQTKLVNVPVAYSYFAQDSALIIDQIPRIKILFPLFFERITNILPIREVIGVSSLGSFKVILVRSFDSFICILPFIACLIIFLKFIKPNFMKSLVQANEKIYREKCLMLLFIFFSAFISLESLMMAHLYNRAYTIQVPFILAVYLLYSIAAANKRKRIFAAIFVILFLCYLSFLPFFRSPYSNLKMYTRHLNLERAKGILVTQAQKELYESLSIYLAANLKKEGEILVLGYYPQISFLTDRGDIFKDDAYIFSRLEVLSAGQGGKDDYSQLSTALEDIIISRIGEEKPGIILSVSNYSFFNVNILSPRIIEYIKSKYFLDKQFGPADVFGRGQDLHMIYSFKSKEN